MRALSLFSGCGGMDFGFARAGIETELALEVKDVFVRSFRSLMPGVDVRSADIREFHDFPRVDIVMGGYPCQPFSMGGNRSPTGDKRSSLFLEFARAVEEVNPRFFVAENVSGLKSLDAGSFFQQQVERFSTCGEGYRISAAVLNAAEYGVPQRRKRLFIVGVRRDLNLGFQFPIKTHGKGKGLLSFASHGDAIKGLPAWPVGEFYERPHDPEGHWSWYYMSRNRKAPWFGPSFTVVANWRHLTLHPGSPVMKLTWSNLADGWKQRWDFSNEYEHTVLDPTLPVLIQPRRLSWRECALIQGFPPCFEPAGSVEEKFEQIGNAVPPALAELVARALVSESGLVPIKKSAQIGGVHAQLSFW